MHKLDIAEYVLQMPLNRPRLRAERFPYRRVSRSSDPWSWAAGEGELSPRVPAAFRSRSYTRT